MLNHPKEYEYHTLYTLKLICCPKDFKTNIPTYTACKFSIKLYTFEPRPPIYIIQCPTNLAKLTGQSKCILVLIILFVFIPYNLIEANWPNRT
jgi:hypothetical protein